MNEENKTPQAPDLSEEEMRMPDTSSKDKPEESSSSVNGFVILLLVVVLLFILGGLYYWFTTLATQNQPVTNTAVPELNERPTAEENNEPESTTAEAAVETMGALSTSDEISSIEADLMGTDIESLDADLAAIDAELEAVANF